MLRLTVNLDTDLNLDIGEETVLNYKGDFSWKEFIQFHLETQKKSKWTIRAPRAIREVQNFLFKHMKAEEVKLDESINHEIWARGIQKIPC